MVEVEEVRNLGGGWENRRHWAQQASGQLLAIAVGSRGRSERIQHGLRPDRQMPHARTRGGKDCVFNRGRDRRRRRLAKADWCFCPLNKFNFTLPSPSHAHLPIPLAI